MAIRLHILLTILGAVLLFSGLWSVTIFQTRSARTLLTTTLADAETSSRSVQSFHRSWLNRVHTMDRYLHGLLPLNQARDDADAAKIRMDQEMNRIEKSFEIITQHGITDFKSQKNIRELKNAAEFADTMQNDMLPREATTATVSAEKINAFVTGITQHDELLHVIVSETDNANRLIIKQAEAPLQRAVRWWPFLLITCILLSSVIAWINARFVTLTFNRLTQEVYQSLQADAAKEGPDTTTNDTGKPTESTPNLFVMVRQLVEKNKAARELVQSTIAQRDESMDRMKVGLERTISDQKRQYEEKITELSTLNKAMIGRELKMARLKQQLEELKKKHGITEETVL